MRSNSALMARGMMTAPRGADRVRRIRRAVFVLLLVALAAAVPALASTERWQDDASGDQGVFFTRDTTRTHVPTFADARPAHFSCSDGGFIDDDLVVVSAGSDETPAAAIASDGSFSYEGP